MRVFDVTHDNSNAKHINLFNAKFKKAMTYGFF